MSMNAHQCAHQIEYRGRFAPTPSGPLHFGSLVAALGSRLDAITHGGEWLVRMEDVDPPRVVAGAADAILHTLEAYGFEWDGAILWQSQRGHAYQAALDELKAQGKVYGCTCTRRVLAESGRRGVDGFIYPGSCRGRPATEGVAQRFLVPDQRVLFEDEVLGRVACDVVRECGDFVLKRADGVFAYQLAVVVDDAEQGITHIVRGADLLVSTPRQRLLQEALALSCPHYMHLPVVLDDGGYKLSKQTLAAPLDDRRPLPAMMAAAGFLGMAMEAVGNLEEFWAQAVQRWASVQLSPIRGRRFNPRSYS